MTDTPRTPAQFHAETDTSGHFVRQQSRFRQYVTADGSSGFTAEPGRYHLYVSYACPWAHRAILFRRLKGLEHVIGMTPVHPERDERGWAFALPGHSPDPVNGFSFLMEAYKATDPGFEGRVTTPTLWDTQEGRVVSNESADIIRMLNSEFNEWARRPELDYFPEHLRDEIEQVNAPVYDNVNNGVYKAGFATTQEAYEEAFDALFETLDMLEQRLSRQRYLAGDRITEADWRLWVTLVRFDAVYYNHFKTNLRRIVDYPNLIGFTRELYQHPGVAETVDMEQVKRHYFRTHPAINPTRIVPKGPAIDFTLPHDRNRFPASEPAGHAAASGRG